MFNLSMAGNRTCHSGGHYRDYYPGAPYLRQVTATYLKIDHRFHLRVPDLQISCTELTTWQRVRLLQIMASGRHGSLKIQVPDDTSILRPLTCLSICSNRSTDDHEWVSVPMTAWSWILLGGGGAFACAGTTFTLAFTAALWNNRKGQV